MGTAASIWLKIVQADVELYMYVPNREYGDAWHGMGCKLRWLRRVQRVAPGAKSGMSEGALSDLSPSRCGESLNG